MKNEVSLLPKLSVGIFAKVFVLMN